MQAPILITGGAQRLGLAMAESLLKQGQEVIITYRSDKPIMDTLAQRGAVMIQCDFAQPLFGRRACDGSGRQWRIWISFGMWL